jgi:hypothetical protein
MKICIGRIVYEKDGKEKYLIALVDYSRVCLISLNSGNRYLSAVMVNDPWDIQPSEFKKMGGDDFYL